MKKDLIYDVGMCDGTDTLHYLQKGYKVVSIEAEPSLVEKAKKKFKQFIQAGTLTIVHCGVAKEDGFADFYISDVMPEWNSFNVEITSRDGLPYRKTQIPCRPFDSILKEFGVPYYLKIDIEGHDKFCIESLDPNDLPHYISFEADNEGNPEMLEMLYEKGYRKFQLINQNTFLPASVPYQLDHDRDSMPWKDKFFLEVMYSKNILLRIARKFKAREIIKAILKPQHHLTYHLGSSGPFGESLTGKWQSFQQVKDLYVNSYKEFAARNKGQYGYWCDFHASL